MAYRSHKVKPRFVSMPKATPPFLLYKYKSNRWWEALGLGYRFSYSVLFMTLETERRREGWGVGCVCVGGGGEAKGNSYIRIYIRGPLDSSNSFLGRPSGSLTGCAPRCSPFTMDLTIGLQRSCVVHIARNSREISIPRVSAIVKLFEGKTRVWNVFSDVGIRTCNEPPSLTDVNTISF